MAAVNIIETRSLSKYFGGVKANDNINFSLPKGQIMALIGPNGAGKSTFVGMLCGRISPTSGQVIYEGRDISALPAHKRIRLGIAYTFQITSIFPGLSVRQNVELAARSVHEGPLDHILGKVDETMQRLELHDLASQRAGKLSYGHQRALEIAMGLVQEPKLFILDEPTQGLTEAEVAQFITLIRSLAGHTTILLIEHNMDVVMKAADFITVLNFGAFLADGTPEEIRHNAAVQAAYLGAAHA